MEEKKESIAGGEYESDTAQLWSPAPGMDGFVANHHSLTSYVWRIERFSDILADPKEIRCHTSRLFACGENQFQLRLWPHGACDTDCDYFAYDLVNMNSRRVDVRIRVELLSRSAAQREAGGLQLDYISRRLKDAPLCTVECNGLYTDCRWQMRSRALSTERRFLQLDDSIHLGVYLDVVHGSVECPLLRNVGGAPLNTFTEFERRPLVIVTSDSDADNDSDTDNHYARAERRYKSLNTPKARTASSDSWDAWELDGESKKELHDLRSPLKQNWYDSDSEQTLLADGLSLKNIPSEEEKFDICASIQSLFADSPNLSTRSISESEPGCSDVENKVSTSTCMALAVVPLSSPAFPDLLSTNTTTVTENKPEVLPKLKNSKMGLADLIKRKISTWIDKFKHRKTVRKLLSCVSPNVAPLTPLAKPKKAISSNWSTVSLRQLKALQKIQAPGQAALRNLVELDSRSVSDRALMSVRKLRVQAVYDLVRHVYSLGENETGSRLQGHLCVDAQDRRIVGDGLVYGELLPSGLSVLLNSKHLAAGQATEFFDLGMGLGKAAMQAFFQYPNLERVVGVELARTRFDKATEAFVNLSEMSSFEHSCNVSVQTSPSAKDVTAIDRLRLDRKEKSSLCLSNPCEKASEFDTAGSLEFRYQDLLEAVDALEADIVLCAVNIPHHLKLNWCEFIARIKPGARVLTYQDLRSQFDECRLHFPFVRLAVNTENDTVDTSWSKSGFRFHLWKKQQT